MSCSIMYLEWYDNNKCYSEWICGPKWVSPINKGNADENKLFLLNTEEALTKNKKQINKYQISIQRVKMQ